MGSLFSSCCCNCRPIDSDVKIFHSCKLKEIGLGLTECVLYFSIGNIVIKYTDLPKMYDEFLNYKPLEKKRDNFFFNMGKLAVLMNDLEKDYILKNDNKISEV